VRPGAGRDLTVLDAIALALAIIVLGYLVVALLWPEKLT
jgi:K+-transporting ATPase KdpF subunit